MGFLTMAVRHSKFGMFAVMASANRTAIERRRAGAFRDLIR
jgi:hypothetical protein